MSYFKGPDIQDAYPEFRPNISVLKVLLETLQKNGNSVAVIEGQTGKSASFHDILQQSTSIAAGLRSAGVTAGDYVVICGNKSIITYSVLVGVIFTGATAVIYPFPHADILHELTKGFPLKALFCDAPLLETLQKSMSYISDQPTLIANMDPEDPVLSSLMSHSTKNFNIFEVKDVHKHTPLIVFSSGTTGVPKGIPIKDIYLQLCGFNLPFHHKSILNASPLYWLSGSIMFIQACFKNYTLVLSNSMIPKENLKLLKKYQTEGFFVGTSSMARSHKDSSFSSFDLSSVKQVFVGGDYILTSVAEAYESKVLGGKIKLNILYGNTEGGMLAIVKPERQYARLGIGICGQVEAGVEIKILDDDGNLVPIGSMGQIWAKSLIQSPGYWGRPDLNIDLYDKDGFMQTGDAGFFDNDGTLYVQGRVGDLINFRGTKVSPAEVENILMSHEAVFDAVVVGKPHPTDIQHLTAFVVRVPGQHVSSQQLEDYVNGKVKENMKLRGGIVFLDQFPRTGLGKVQRTRLRELASLETTY